MMPQRILLRREIRQVIRGCVYLAVQILFILYMVFFGGNYIILFFENFFTGGNVGRIETYVSNEWDYELSEYKKVPGDNSFHIILYF